MEHNYHYYNKNLKDYARNNRTASTKGEVKLWAELLKSKKMGYSFLRQRPILNFIADFLSKDLMLIIEIDGITHQGEKSERDKIRDEQLQALGYSVLRFTESDVMNNIEGVEIVIKRFIEKFESKQG